MEDINSCSYTITRRCDTGGFCGPHAHVAYVQMPVFKSCGSCQNSCVACQNHKAKIQMEKARNGMNQECLSQTCILKADRKNVGTTGCQLDHSPVCGGISSHPPESNNVCGLAFCNAGHLHELTGAHALMFCPQLLQTCCAHVLLNNPTTSGASNQEKEISSHVTPSNFEEAAKSKVLRKSSADSGRITWSDSGDSVFSDIQGGDSTLKKTGVSRSQHHINPSPIIQALSHATTVCPDGNTMARPADHDIPPGPRSTESQQRVSSTQSRPMSHDVRLKYPSSEPCDKGVSASKSKAKRRFAKRYETEQKEFSIITPRRSNSECALKNTPKVKFPSPSLGRLTEHNALAKDITQKRPRSRSLFLISSEQEGMPYLSSPPRALRHRTPNQTSNVDFTAWSQVVEHWEIRGDVNGKEGIKSYGITAVPSMNGFAVTDADKVKIKLYNMEGELKSSFGTPTWPRYGRGITLTQDGAHLAVCHLSEVCTYTLEGKVVDRFAHENFTACWGIAVDNKRNFVVTDPKSSSVFIMTRSGEVIEQIGGTTKPTCRKQSKNTTRISWRKNKTNQQKTVTPKARQASDSIRCMSNVSLPLSGMNNGSSPSRPNEKKKVRLLAPRYVAVNSKNQILVTDTRQRCLLAFDEEGTLLFSIGGGRTGCEKCCREDEMQFAATTGPSAASAETVYQTEDPSRKEVYRKPCNPSSKKPFKTSESHNILTEICGSSALCANKRVKAVGVTNRGSIGRNESVESEAYCAKKESPADDDKMTGRVRSPTQGRFVSSSSVGNRLYDYADDSCGPASSIGDLSSFVPKDDDSQTPGPNNPSKLKQFKSRIFKAPTWLRKRSRKKPVNVSMSQVGRCESLTSLSCSGLTVEDGTNSAYMVASQSADSFPQSPLTPHGKYQFTPETDVTTFTYGSLKGSSMPSSPIASPPTPLTPDAPRADFYLDHVTGYESCPEPESEDEDRAACRRCHVEDPRGVCVDHNSNILLVDRARHRVTVFTPEGHFVRHLLTKEDGLHEPMTACVLPDGCLAVTDSSSSIKVFNFA